MGNVLKSLYSCCCKPTTTGDSEFPRPHGVSTTTAGVSALAHDLLNFEITSQVPEGLSNHVVSSKKSQAKWYRKLLQAWKEAKPPPKTAPEAAYLVILTLSKHQKADVEGLLAFYGLPLLQHSAEIPASLLDVVQHEGMQTLPDGVQFEMQTLPVDAKAVGDGDGMTVYVSTSDPRESENIPREVLLSAVRRSKARARKNYTRADALHQKIIDSGYRVIFIQNEEVLARKYRIRLRGIDAPEMAMPYGNEAKDVLTKLVQGKCLRVLVYDEDQFGRIVCDAYCNGVFVQEVMLKKGFAWHHKVYDQRVKFANWENEARGKRIGLWASANPEKPWEWKRRNKREG